MRLSSSCSFLSTPLTAHLPFPQNLFIAHPSLACVFVVDKHGVPKARIQSGGDRPLVTNCIFGSGADDKQRLYITNSLDGRIEYVDWHCKGGTPIR